MSVSAKVANRILPAKERSWNPGWPRILCLLGLLFAVALFHIYAQVRTLNASYQVSREIKLQQEHQEMHRRLKVELNILCSPERLERLGARLGLAPPSAAQMRELK